MNAIIYLLFLTAGFLMGRLTKPLKITIVTTPTEPEEESKPAIKIPNPLQAYREHKEREEEKKEVERLEIIMENIESYDGTGAKQKDVPIRS